MLIAAPVYQSCKHCKSSQEKGCAHNDLQDRLCCCHQRTIMCRGALRPPLYILGWSLARETVLLTQESSRKIKEHKCLDWSGKYAYRQHRVKGCVAHNAECEEGCLWDTDSSEGRRGLVYLHVVKAGAAHVGAGAAGAAPTPRSRPSSIAEIAWTLIWKQNSADRRFCCCPDI